MADLDMSGTVPTCHRWNNADSCIVQWTNVPFWGPSGPVGSHTFEIILSRLDSSITYEYGTLTGVAPTADFLVGIENVSGTMGLKHSNDVYPAQNNAIFWDYPANPSVPVHDLGAEAAANLNSQGFFVLQGGTVNPTGWIKNTGNQTETSYQVNCTFQLVGGGVVYNQTQTITTPIAPNATTQINFTPAWTASATGSYFYRITVTLVGDMNPNNNIMNAEMDVMTLPGTMGYDVGTTVQAWSWSGGLGGLGNHFVPPSYPAQIDCVKFFIVTGGNSFQARVYDDDGLGGQPGTQLWSATILTPTPNTWYGGTPNLSIASGGFYVSWEKVDALTTPTFGVDNTTTQPFSRQGWEHTGGNTWSGFRQSEGSDIMIRTKIHAAGADLDVTMAPINPPINIPANGGSFNFNATVQRNVGPAVSFWAWARNRYPSGTYSGILLGPVNINPPVGVTVTRTRTQVVNNVWPAGANYMIGYAGPVSGSYPATDADSFLWTKLTTSDGGPLVWEVANYGEEFPYLVGGSSTPQSFALVGASPNPFNPSTTISYKLSTNSLVSLKVYDTAGRLVNTLVNGQREAGSYQITFDGSNLASGVYLYSLTAGSNYATGKMVLLK
jgi:hypothetical protein